MQQVDPHRARKNGIFLLIFGALIIIALFAAILDPNRIQAVNSAGRSDACFMSQKFVRQNLKAPTTAEFPDWTQENCQTTHAGDTWTVTSYVDSQNGFGAMIRSDYTANMTYHPDRDTWTLTGLTIQAR